MKTYKEFSTWLLNGVVMLLIVVLGYFGRESLEELKLIRQEMSDLNLKMVEIVGNQTWHEKEIDALKVRVFILENKAK